MSQLLTIPAKELQLGDALHEGSSVISVIWGFEQRPDVGGYLETVQQITVVSAPHRFVWRPGTALLDRDYSNPIMECFDADKPLVVIRGLPVELPQEPPCLSPDHPH